MGLTRIGGARLELCVQGEPAVVDYIEIGSDDDAPIEVGVPPSTRKTPRVELTIHASVTPRARQVLLKAWDASFDPASERPSAGLNFEQVRTANEQGLLRRIATLEKELEAVRRLLAQRAIVEVPELGDALSEDEDDA